ncbi:MAG TPA: SDR family NAD(P)-dependent oxidoreductase, partial [Planctomycetes bacterium]|nr:SDR family NAD(P)-dependent oxidoreductase [Planctomycetota bacterium]
MTDPASNPGAKGAIVIGASSGMGAALVRRLAAEGWNVAALARRGGALAELADSCASSPGRVVTRSHDVHETEQVPELFAELVRELGCLDLIVYAAGIMPEVGEQEYDTERDLDVLAVNTGGCVAWCNQAAELFRTQRRGTIVGISSIAGDRGRVGNPIYCTSKAAMNTYLEALRNRLAAFDVHVCTIKPGFIQTPMTEGVEGMFWLIDADEAAKRIL